MAAHALDYPHPNAIIRAFRPEYLLVVAERDRVAPLYADPQLLAEYEAPHRAVQSGRRARAVTPALDTLRRVGRRTTWSIADAMRARADARHQSAISRCFFHRSHTPKKGPPRSDITTPGAS